MRCYRLLFTGTVPWHAHQLGQPYSLVYGMEAVLPIEVQIPSLRIMKDAGLSEDDWIQTRLDQLNLIDEKRLIVVCHGQAYQKRMIKGG